MHFSLSSSFPINKESGALSNVVISMEGHCCLKRLKREISGPLDGPKEAHRHDDFQHLIMKNEIEEAQSFLSKTPHYWNTDTTYQKGKERVKNMTVVNDCEERGIALIKDFNNTITKDETQKQYLLRVVAQHRKKFKEQTKTGLKNS